jgi:hypothetical protein
MTREEIIAHEAIEAAIADTGNGRSRDGYYINALADHENGFKEGFIAGAQWADAHPHWISVKDEMPPCGVEVIVFAKCWNRPTLGEYDGKGKFYCLDIFDEVTHWMPLPALPEGGER